MGLAFFILAEQARKKAVPSLPIEEVVIEEVVIEKPIEEVTIEEVVIGKSIVIQRKPRKPQQTTSKLKD